MFGFPESLDLLNWLAKLARLLVFDFEQLLSYFLQNDIPFYFLVDFFEHIFCKKRAPIPAKLEVQHDFLKTVLPMVILNFVWKVPNFTKFVTSRKLWSWLVGWFCMVGWLVGWLLACLLAWMLFWFALLAYYDLLCLVDLRGSRGWIPEIQPNDALRRRLVEFLVFNWLVGWLVGSLVGWLDGWLVGWLGACLLAYCLVGNF